MATKPTFANLKLKTNSETVTVQHEGLDIEVLQYLPIEDKFDLIQIAVQKSITNGYVDPTLLEMNFMLNVIYMYTNITFTEKQRENEAKIYDAFESSGLADLIFQAIPERERNEVCDKLEDTVRVATEYAQSTSGVINSLIKELPEAMSKTVDLINTLSPENFEEARNFVKFAKESNNNMPFPKE